MHKLQNREKSFDPARTFVAEKNFTFSGKAYRRGDLFDKGAATLRQLQYLFTGRLIKQLRSGEAWKPPEVVRVKQPGGPKPKEGKPRAREKREKPEPKPITVRHVGHGQYAVFRHGKRESLATYAKPDAEAVARELLQSATH